MSHETHEAEKGVGAFRYVPYMGVIYVVAEVYSDPVLESRVGKA